MLRSRQDRRDRVGGARRTGSSAVLPASSSSHSLNAATARAIAISSRWTTPQANPDACASPNGRTRRPLERLPATSSPLPAIPPIECGGGPLTRKPRPASVSMRLSALIDRTIYFLSCLRGSSRSSGMSRISSSTFTADALMPPLPVLRERRCFFFHDRRGNRGDGGLTIPRPSFLFSIPSWRYSGFRY